jgi:hypothetical protein
LPSAFVGLVIFVVLFVVLVKFGWLWKPTGSGFLWAGPVLGDFLVAMYASAVCALAWFLLREKLAGAIVMRRIIKFRNPHFSFQERLAAFEEAKEWLPYTSGKPADEFKKVELTAAAIFV